MILATSVALGCLICVVVAANSRTKRNEAFPPLFFGRTVIQRPAKARGVTPNIFVKSTLANTFASLDASKSLLLHDCKGNTWCEGGDVSFETIFTKGLAGGDRSFAAANLATWYQTASQGEEGKAFSDRLSPWKGEGFDKLDMQLLAVVNRMDLADWRVDTSGCGAEKLWRGAELRYVYGPKGTDKSPPTPFTLIIEFVLPGMTWKEFRDLANLWKSHTSGSPGANIIQASRLAESSKVRLRTNYLVDPTNWLLSEWNFDTAGGFRQVRLEEEVATSLEYPPSAGYFALWDRKQMTSPGRLPILPASLWEGRSVKYSGFEVLSSVPRGVFPADQDVLRNVISLQQCRYCHSKEGGTNFNHIPNRLPGEDSDLSVSKFLCDKPAATLAGLFQSDSGSVCTGESLVYYKTDMTKASVTRVFSDLARRRLFLSAVSLAGDSYSDQAYQDIRLGQANFSH